MQKNKISKQTIISLITVFIAIPITLFLGIYLLEDRKYYFISLLVILEIFIPFMVSFEEQRPRARELVIISIMSAIAVASRMAFYMLQFFKPMTSVIIVSGIVFGPQTGFLVGAISAFVSNFQFGQGPWTPWMMFAWGIIGFLAGLIFRSESLKNSRIVLAIFGFFSVFLVYGPIVNIGSAFMMQAHPESNAILVSCLMGLKYDAIHGVSTAIFMLIAGKAMLEILNRVKRKYGIKL